MNNSAFKTCSQYVRRVPCDACRYCAQCKAHGAPVSHLARYLHFVKTKLPAVQSQFRACVSIKNLALRLGLPTDPEAQEGAYAVVVVYHAKREDRNSYCRALLDGSEETAADILDKVLATYISTYLKRKGTYRNV